MNNRLTIQDLAGLLAEYTRKDKQYCERFLREFITVISEGVFTDKLVKVKGLGTFKIILVEKRESIHVNTGERFLIPAHYKFSFLPDKELREQVNKPFSFFETTELQEDVDFTDLDVIPGEPEDNDKEAESVEEVLLENKSLQKSVEESVSRLNMKEETVSQQLEEGILEKVSELESDPDTVESKSQRDITSAEIQAPIELGTKDPIALSTQEEQNKTRRTFKKPMIVLAAISAILLLFNAYLYFKCDFFTDGKMIEGEEVEKVIVVVDSEVDSVMSGIVVDTTTMINLIDSLPKEIIQKKEDKPIDKRPEVIAEVKIERGSRLTMIALKYYGHKLYWVYIYEYNKAIIADPNNIPIGTIIKIPAPEIYNINRKDRATLEKAAIRQTEILNGLTK
ncbi:MAG: HU family DNA-binding protein [Parabacteroides distasonis]|nr:HU family DNA-binding protein [Parabacteroides distasonis]